MKNENNHILIGDPEILDSKDCISVKPSHEINFAHTTTNYSAELTLFNKKDLPVIFKIRTTAAKSYVVLPTAGQIPPGDSTIVKIYMLPRESIRNRADDKFLVQAFICSDEDLKIEPKAIHEKFDQMAKLNCSQYFHNSKLKVHFAIGTVIKEAFSEDNTPIRRRTKTLGHIPSNDTSQITTAPRKSDTLVQSPVVSKLAQRTRIGFFEKNPIVTRGEDEVVNFSPRDLIERGLGNSFLEKLTHVLNRALKTHNPRIVVPRTDLSISSHDFLPPNKGGIMARTISSAEKAEECLYIKSHEMFPHGPNHFTPPAKSREGTAGSREGDHLLSTGEGSHVESSMSPAKQAAMYKQKFLSLEKRFRHQKLLLSKINEEKAEYLTELNVLKLSAIDETKDGGGGGDIQPNIGNNKFQMWQLLVVSTIFLILGSLWK